MSDICNALSAPLIGNSANQVIAKRRRAGPASVKMGAVRIVIPINYGWLSGCLEGKQVFLHECKKCE